MDGQKISKARDTWFDGPEGQRCTKGSASEQYLKNRLERAFIAGVDAAEQGYPIQDGENIPEWLAKLVYREYSNLYRSQQSYERIRERGGFGAAEVVWLLNLLDAKTIEKAGQILKGG